MSNNRLLKLENGRVTFRYRDTETGAEKRCSLGAQEFIHRFLQHVLPHHFVKVRYYGFFAPTRRARLNSLRNCLLATAHLTTPSADPTTSAPGIGPVLSNTILCPHCGQPMLFVHTLAPLLCRSP